MQKQASSSAKRKSPAINSVNFTASTLDSKAVATIAQKLSPKPAAKKAKTATPTRAQRVLKKTSKRGENVDYADLSHKVTAGVYEGFSGKLVTEEDLAAHKFGGMSIIDDTNEEKQMKQFGEGVVSLCLLKNKRGNKPRESKIVTFKTSEVEELGLEDMFHYISNGDDEEEDEGVIEAEKKLWTCASCNHKNTHDAGYCGRRIDNGTQFGTSCGEPRGREVMSEGWAGCFGRMDELWKCEQCMTPNKASVTACACCDAARPGVGGNVAPEGSPTETAAQGCIGGGGFTFPVAN